MPARLATEAGLVSRRRRRISDRRFAVLVAAGSLSLYGGLVVARPELGAIHAVPGAMPIAIGFTFGPAWGGTAGLLASLAVGAALCLRYGSAWAPWLVPDWVVGFVLLVGAGLLSGAVARVRFHRTVELLHLVRELRRARAVLAALYESGKIITSELEMDKLIDRLLRLVRDMFGYPNPAILLVDEEAGGLRLAGAYGYDAPDNLRIPLERGVTGYVARTGLAVRVDDVTRDSRYIPGVRGARSEIAVPIHIKERVLGVLNVESTKVSAFTDEDVRVLQMVADQAAVALQNAHLLGLTAHMAVTDGLTELYNRRYFIQQIELKVERARRTGAPVSLVLMDIDDFKHFNDQFGHLV
ncbi:MAG: sensor domain-containing diguanylate cyclase, partial [Bacillota bacterium]